MAQEYSKHNLMTAVIIKDGKIELRLTLPLSKVRICDNSGNHLSSPTSQSVKFADHYIEWMISNSELSTIISQIYSRDDVLALIDKLNSLNVSLIDTEYYGRKAQKERTDHSIAEFSIYKYEEVFYSFEKNIDSSLQVKITFKMGDYRLAAHMFVLIHLNNSDISLINKSGNIEDNSLLGSGAKCLWSPAKKTIGEIAYTLASSSAGHKKDIIALLNDIIKQ